MVSQYTFLHIKNKWRSSTAERSSLLRKRAPTGGRDSAIGEPEQVSGQRARTRRGSASSGESFYTDDDGSYAGDITDLSLYQVSGNGATARAPHNLHQPLLPSPSTTAAEGPSRSGTNRLQGGLSGKAVIGGAMLVALGMLAATTPAPPSVSSSVTRSSASSTALAAHAYYNRPPFTNFGSRQTSYLSRRTGADDSSLSMHRRLKLDPCIPDEGVSQMRIDVGTALGWISTFLYLNSRIPQVYKNFKRQSVEGLSWLMFFCAFMGNLTTGEALYCVAGQE